MLLNEGYHQPPSQLSRVELTKTDDSGEQQLLVAKGVADEVIGGNEMVLKVQQHGFTSHAPKGSEGIVMSMGGNRDQHVMLGMENKDKRYKDLPEGGVAFYDGSGQAVLDGSGNLTITVKKMIIKADSLEIDAPVDMKQTLNVDGEVTTGASITSAGAHTAAAHN